MSKTTFKKRLVELGYRLSVKDHNKGYGDGFEKGLIDGRKESLKKVVEYLVERWNGTEYEDVSNLSEIYKIVAIPEADWQSLLDEVK